VLRERFGVEAITLYCAHYHKNYERSRKTGLYVVENHSSGWSPPEGARWAGEEVVQELRLPVEEFRPAIAQWLEEQRTGQVPALRAPWGRKGWYDGAVEWARESVEGLGLSLSGQLEQAKHRDISTVFRVPTSGGDYYFKAVPGIFAHEPRITAELARLYPGIVPGPAPCLAIEIHQRHEPFRMSADDGERQRESERSRAHDGLRRAADGDPHGNWLLQGAWINALACERRSMLPRPGDVLVLAQLEQKAELFGEQLVVIVQALAEQRIRLDEASPARHDLGTAAREEVDRCELFEHYLTEITHKLEDISLVFPIFFLFQFHQLEYQL
jgi:hypothetical protein